MSKRFFALAALAAASLSAQAQVQLTAASLNYSQNFDTLASSGTTGTALPPGWALFEKGTSNNVNNSYGVGDGSGNAGNTYSFGKAGSTERALGSLRSSTLEPMFGVSFVNLAGRAIESVSIGYIGEQWRLGGTGRNDRLNFQYSTDATALNSGTWTSVSTLDFIAPKSSGATVLDGNVAANRSAIAGSISGLNLAQGGNLWLRWTDPKMNPGSDDGLAIDDFSFNATLAPVPEPSTYALLLAGLCAVGLMSRRRLGR
ncbi:MAG: PEP-CTERM sorting domain-containing protein [Roseateles asaccharophilus]|uniref:PEP-CTERM sorting domain-containing protein n=1 Tax=Roseateles asaccharophilus TaxID=582607 RepID=UPI003919B7A1